MKPDAGLCDVKNAVLSDQFLLCLERLYNVEHGIFARHSRDADFGVLGEGLQNLGLDYGSGLSDKFGSDEVGEVLDIAGGNDHLVLFDSQSFEDFVESSGGDCLALIFHFGLDFSQKNVLVLVPVGGREQIRQLVKLEVDWWVLKGPVSNDCEHLIIKRLLHVEAVGDLPQPTADNQLQEVCITIQVLHGDAFIIALRSIETLDHLPCKLIQLFLVMSAFLRGDR